MPLITNTPFNVVPQPSNLVLMHFDTTSWVEEVSGNNGTASGVTLHTGSNKKFGAGSAEASGDPQYLDVATNSVSLTGDFTVDFWVEPTVAWTGGLSTLFVAYQSGSPITTAGFRVYAHDTGATNWAIGFQEPSDIPNTFNLNTPVAKTNPLTHIAFVREGTTVKSYRDGSNIASDTISGTLTFDAIRIFHAPPAFQSSDDQVQGYIDELRIIDTAVWTSGFTPPTAPYS